MKTGSAIKFKRGDFVIGLPEASENYAITKENVMAYVQEEKEQVDMWSAKKKPRSMIRVVPFEKTNRKGNDFWVEAKHFRLASTKEVVERKEAVKRGLVLASDPRMMPGKMVSLRRDVRIEKGFFIFSFSTTLRRGASGIIDTNSIFPDGKSQIEDKEEEGDLVVENGGVRDMEMAPGIKLSDFIIPAIKVFFPDMESEENVPLDAVEPKIYDPEIEKKIVLPEGYMDRVMNVTSRVLQSNTHANIYNQLGLSRVCQKGRGAIILLYGPPGTGKTMLAEVVAEKLEKPLIRVNIAGIGSGDQIQESLKQAFRRANRYNGILLLDEVDVFIRKRGEHPIFDQNTSIFLRGLEYYDGILFLTTNLINHIDSAVFSRVHVTLGFEANDSVGRRKIWEAMIPDELRAAMRGNEVEHNAMLDHLSRLELNGREIKNVIQNAVTHAVVKLGKADLPKTKWIPTGYFVEEAERLLSLRNELKS